MAKQDYYATLGRGPRGERRRPEEGLPQARHAATIRTAIRATSRPRRKFKEINEAYDVLKDEQKRAAYDRFGHAAFEQGGAGRPGGFDFAAGGGLDDIFDQMFGEFMGGGRRGGGRHARRRRPAPGGRDRPREAFTGVKVNLRVPTRVACDACAGTGSEDKNAPADTCPTCQRRRQGARAAGLLPRRAHLPDLRRRRAG